MGHSQSGMREGGLDHDLYLWLLEPSKFEPAGFYPAKRDDDGIKPPHPQCHRCARNFNEGTQVFFTEGQLAENAYHDLLRLLRPHIPSIRGTMIITGFAFFHN